MKGRLNRQYPKLTKQFHPSLNGDIRPKNIEVGQVKKYYWWKCPKKNCRADFKATIRQMLSGDIICPVCKERAVRRQIKKAKNDPLFLQWLELEALFGEIDEHIEELLNEDNSKNKKLKHGLKSWRKIDAIEKSLKQFRKISVQVEIKDRL